MPLAMTNRGGIRTMKHDRATDRVRYGLGEEVLLRPCEAAAFLGIARGTLYKWEKERPDFPRRVRLSARASGWWRHELRAWLERQREAAG